MKRAPDLFSRAGFERFAGGLPAAEIVRQWGDASVARVGGKIFALLSGADSEAPGLSFKCSDLAFRLLPELEGVRPAPYLARAKWVHVAKQSGLPGDALASYVAEAHRLIAGRLTRKAQAELGLTRLNPARRDRL
jgi:predicted DNA-binding protein (MmcQ/YjbR family)